MAIYPKQLFIVRYPTFFLSKLVRSLVSGYINYVKCLAVKGKIPPPEGLQQPTFELEVQHAIPLSQKGFMFREQGNFCFLVLLKTSLFFLLSLILDACWLMKRKFNIDTAHGTCSYVHWFNCKTILKV